MGIRFEALRPRLSLVRINQYLPPLPYELPLKEPTEQYTPTLYKVNVDLSTKWG